MLVEPNDSICDGLDIGGLEQMGNESHVSKAELRKNNRKLRNGPGRNNCLGGRVEKSKGFPPNSFDRVLLDAPCSALGLRPRLFAGEVWNFAQVFLIYLLLGIGSLLELHSYINGLALLFTQCRLLILGLNES